MQPSTKYLTINCLLVQQNKRVPIFAFGIEGRLIHSICSVSYAERNRDGALVGYQRPTVEKHIRAILEYLSEANALLPNAIVVAFDSRTQFEKLRGSQSSEWGSFGKLKIPLVRNATESKAGWIVDGQQRASALARLDPKKSFPVVVVGFQSDNQAVQREQFIRVNKTKPLPRDLLVELLPEMESSVPRDMEKRQLAAKVLKSIRFDERSPFFERIRGLGAKTEGANISQSALISLIQGSLQRRGVLFYYSNAKGQRHDVKGMARAVTVFFEGVRRTWPDAWEGNPTSSRLVHGAGITAMGCLMDRVMTDVDVGSSKAVAVVANRLERIKGRCAWTSGKWPVLGLKWNEIQNTSQDKARLTEFILKEYSSK